MNGEPTLKRCFFCTNTGAEPVREWLRSLDENAKKTIGRDIKTVQFGWPNEITPGLATRLRNVQDLWEVCSKVSNKNVRVLFIIKENKMVLLHEFFKKRPKVTKEISLAQERLNHWNSGNV